MIPADHSRCHLARRVRSHGNPAWTCHATARTEATLLVVHSHGRRSRSPMPGRKSTPNRFAKTARTSKAPTGMKTIPRAATIVSANTIIGLSALRAPASRTGSNAPVAGGGRSAGPWIHPFGCGQSAPEVLGDALVEPHDDRGRPPAHSGQQQRGGSTDERPACRPILAESVTDALIRELNGPMEVDQVLLSPPPRAAHGRSSSRRIPRESTRPIAAHGLCIEAGRVPCDVAQGACGLLRRVRVGRFSVAASPATGEPTAASPGLTARAAAEITFEPKIAGTPWLAAHRRRLFQRWIESRKPHGSIPS